MSMHEFSEFGVVRGVLPYDANGHTIWHADEVTVVKIEDELMVVDAGYQCGVCAMHPRYIFASDGIRVVDPCPYPDGITTVIELKVPSGKMIVTDDLRPVYDYDLDDFASYNATLGQHQVIEAMAAIGCAYGPVGNTSPGLYRTGPDTYIIASPPWEADDEELWDEVAIPGADKVASICTDLWAYSIADFDDWVSRGGDPGSLSWHRVAVDVTPGVYRFTHHTGERGFDRDASGVVFAHIERIGDV